MTYEFVGDELDPPPPPPPPAEKSAASAASSAAGAPSSQQSVVPSQPPHGLPPSPRGSVARPPPPPPPQAPRPPPQPRAASAAAPVPPPPPPPFAPPVAHPPAPPPPPPAPPPVPQRPLSAAQVQHRLQAPVKSLQPGGAVNEYFAPTPAELPQASGGPPVPVAGPPVHPTATKEVLCNDYFAAPPAGPAPRPAASAVPPVTPSLPSAENIPLPGHNLPERGESAHSSVHGPSAVDDKKESEHSTHKKPSVWTQVQAAHRKDFKTPADYKLKPQRETKNALCSEPSSGNVKEEESTDNKNNKKDGRDREKEKDSLAEIQRKAKARALKKGDAKDPVSAEESSWENGRLLKEPKCTILVSLGIVLVCVLLGIGIVFSLAAAGAVQF